MLHLYRALKVHPPRRGVNLDPTSEFTFFSLGHVCTRSSNFFFFFFVSVSFEKEKRKISRSQSVEFQKIPFLPPYFIYQTRRSRSILGISSVVIAK